MILTGKTQKGKNRVRELGAEWAIVRLAESVVFSQDAGPWALVQPRSTTNPDKSRWINLRTQTSDKDFDTTTQLGDLL